MQQARNYIFRLVPTRNRAASSSLIQEAYVWALFLVMKARMISVMNVISKGLLSSATLGSADILRTCFTAASLRGAPAHNYQPL